MKFSKPIQALSLLASVIPGISAAPSHSKNATHHTPTVGGTRDAFLRRLLQESFAYGNFSTCSPSQAPLKVGIIGAGAAGLYSALLLQSLGIDYEILEANTRIGGRMYTHRFDEAAWAASKPGEPAYYNYFVSPNQDHRR